MTILQTPQTRCRVAVARADMTPPIGIYHRMWGAATQDRATGVHRPLYATLLWLEPLDSDTQRALVIVALDHCLLDEADVARIRQATADAGRIRPEQVLVTLSHTHAAGLMSRTRADLPGGDLIGPYLDSLAALAGRLAGEAVSLRRSATIVYGRGRCNLAANRDFWDSQRQQYVVGLNPAGPADDTVLLAKLVAEDGLLLATVVNYACHATTLAWENTLISPDYPGALRETVERQTGVPCLFLQGASGDLGPREGFVGDPAVADRNGRQLGYAALSALEALPPPGMVLAYQGPVVSGATLGVWRYAPEEETIHEKQKLWQIDPWRAALPYRHDAPTLQETQRARDHWQQAEERARLDGDEALVRDCRARVEQMTRQVWRLESLPTGKTYPLNVTLARLGESVWLFVAGEHYQTLQTTLRERHPALPLFVVTHTNGWQPGYIPPASKYGYGIYQEQIALVGAGSAELLIEEISRRLEKQLR